MTEQNSAKSRKKLLIWGIVLFALWLAGGFGLFHASLDSPMPPDKEYRPFKLIPTTDD